MRRGISSDRTTKNARDSIASRRCSTSFLIKRCGSQRSSCRIVRTRVVTTIKPLCVAAILWSRDPDNAAIVPRLEVSALAFGAHSGARFGDCISVPNRRGQPSGAQNRLVQIARFFGRCLRNSSWRRPAARAASRASAAPTSGLSASSSAAIVRGFYCIRFQFSILDPSARAGRYNVRTPESSIIKSG